MKSKNRRYLLQTPVDDVKKSDVLESIQKSIKTGVKITTIFTPNPEIVMLARRNREFRRTLSDFDLALPDGIGLIIAGRVLGLPIRRRVTGVDIMKELVERAQIQRIRVGLIGGQRGVALELAECLRRQHAGLDVFAVGDFAVDAHGLIIRSAVASGARQARQSFEVTVEERIVGRIRSHDQPVVLFVALGAPKQEFFITRLKKEILKLPNAQPVVLMAVGGAFDTLTGRVPRAPHIVQRIGLEWLWRLLRQPWRLQRQLRLAEFAWAVLQAKLKTTSDVVLRW